jgi:hypothetical protein
LEQNVKSFDEIVKILSKHGIKLTKGTNKNKGFSFITKKVNSHYEH